MREYLHPGRWKYRDLLVEFDRTHGMDGSWVEAIDDVFDHAWLLEQKDMLHAVAVAMSRPYAIATRNIADIADLI
ncbi:MAG TPA: hypothetical protein ENJ16_02135 [Planctomycetaceae bacterium]|nr:hypothetical protein [Planctomycetaceae bacterium]